MKTKLILLIVGTLLVVTMAGVRIVKGSRDTIAAPILKWQHGGCYQSWCETGWYSSPAVADLDNDGQAEVIASPYSLYVLNGQDGSVQWRVDPPGGRTWPGVVVADLDHDGDEEIVVAQGGGHVSVYQGDGSEVWSQQPVSRELRGLSAYDLDGDGSLEIIVTAAVDSRTNTWVFEHDGSLRAGWPQLSNDSGYAWGTFNDNAAMGDIDGDGSGEIVVPSDVHYINAYEDDGGQIQAHPMFGDKGWGKVGVHVSHEVDLRGYAHCGSEHRPNFAHTPAAVADLDGDGYMEIVTTGNVYNCGTSPYTSLYEMPFIFNADRSRWSASGFNWVEIPLPDGRAGPLEENYNVIENAMANPAVADLDGDGYMEILFASYDGRLHAYWLDKTEHHNWPFDVSNTGPGIRFASEPVVIDLDNNGTAEVIFSSWPEKGSGYVGKLHILDHTGSILHELWLPSPYGSADWNGALAAPTVDNIDGDSDIELVLNTSHSGIVAYDLPQTANARILWRSGRSNYQRTGSKLSGDLSASSISAEPRTPGSGDSVGYVIELVNSGPRLDTVALTNTLPLEISFSGNLSATSGSVAYSSGSVTWQGPVSAPEPVVISYTANVSADISEPTAIFNRVLVDDGLDTSWLTSLIIANGLSGYLPKVAR